jgi:hypothetical protein
MRSLYCSAIAFLIITTFLPSCLTQTPPPPPSEKKTVPKITTVEVIGSNTKDLIANSTISANHEFWG